MIKMEFSDDERLYISLLQENICRMANNSANCKTWLITILSALLALQATSGSRLMGLALIPAILFYFLDSYYLGLERRFIKIENRFVKAKQNGDDTEKKLFDFDFDTKNIVCDCEATLDAMKSHATRPFYITIILVILTIEGWPWIKEQICNSIN